MKEQQIVPVALAFCKKLGISPVPSIICIAVSSNLQGAATLVGDTTSILLAKAANLDFSSFFVDNDPEHTNVTVINKEVWEIKAAAAVCGGGGGGRPNMAQAGGKDAAKIGEALVKAKEVLEGQL